MMLSLQRNTWGNLAKSEGSVQPESKIESDFTIHYSNLSGFESYPVPNQVVVSSRTTQQLFN